MELPVYRSKNKSLTFQDKKLLFLDTIGHEVFMSHDLFESQVADIANIVAADEKSQTTNNRSSNYAKAV